MSRRWVRIAVWRERIRGSLFVVPLVFVAAGVVVAETVVQLDQRLQDAGHAFPISLSATVDGARAVLTTVATATVTVAGIAFSISLLVFQQAASQHTPRVVHSLFRDPFNKRVIGLVGGTFAYCLVVLRVVRDPLDPSGSAVVPSLSVAGAVLLGLGSLLAIVAFIDHSAHAMEVSELLQRIADDTFDELDRPSSDGRSDGLEPVVVDRLPSGPGLPIAADDHGWVQDVDRHGLLDVLAPGSTVALATMPGRYLTESATICTVWPAPTAERADAVTEAVRRSVLVGRTRTLHQDPAYGLRQLTDVAVRALSPGVNDPTTAQDAIFHLAAVLVAVLARPEPAPMGDGAGRVIVPAPGGSFVDLVDGAFDEIRRDASAHPAVCRYLLEAIHLVRDALGDDRDPRVGRALLRQAHLVVEGCAAAEPLAADLDQVVAAYERRFGRHAIGG